MLLVDTHVHWHQQFDSSQFLEAAWCNFSSLTEPGEDSIYVMFVAAINGRGGLDALLCQLQINNNWQVETESCGMVSVRQGAKKIYLVAANQINTAEKLEVILVGSGNHNIASQQPLAWYLEHCREETLLIAPWGFGKWLGARRNILKTVLANSSRLLISDTKLRPNWFREPLFQSTAPLLVGTDPLPLANHVTAPGRLISVLEATQLNQILNTETWNRATVRGKRTGTFEALRDQIQLRLSQG